MQKALDWNTLLSQKDGFGKKLESALNELGILEKCRELPIDHICIRLRESKNVDALKGELLNVGQLISSANVNGREILIIQLHDPLEIGSWKVFGVELPYPKPEQTYSDGWEHVEFVLNGAEDIEKAFLSQLALDKEYLKSTYKYSLHEPLVDTDQLPNPTISLKVSGVGIKFHANPIQRIVGFR